MAAMLVVLALCGVASGGSGGQSAVSDDPWLALLEALSKNTVQAHIHSALAKPYGLSSERAGGFSSELGDYSLLEFPVQLSLSEEWPSVYSGSLHLLQDPLYGRLLELLESARKERLDRRSPLERLYFQADLWAVYDTLFLECGVPRVQGPAIQQRCQKLLLAVAALIRWIALDNQALSNLPSSKEIREEVFRQNGVSGLQPTEFYTVETHLFHDFAHRFRRINHFYYWDPQRNFASLSGQDLEGINTRALPLSHGAVAMIEEDLIAVLKDGSLHATTVPALFKVYVVRGQPIDEQPLAFAMYRVDRKSTSLGVEALRPAPKETEAWAQIDLPNMPNRTNKPALRAPMQVVCSGCHGRYPNAFCPTSSPLDSSLYRFSVSPQSFTARRNMQSKVTAAEYQGLVESFQIGASTEVKGMAAGGESESGSFSGEEKTGLAVARIGGCVVLVLVIFLIRRYLRRPAQQEA